MGLLEMITLALALSMDAFAVALCKGACLAEMKDKGEGIAIAASFGFFQAMMPLAGWYVGTRFYRYIEAIDHYIAFGLLAFIGIKLVAEAWKNRNEPLVCTPLKLSELLLLSIATSIDALAAGIAIAMLNVNIWTAVGLIGVITLLLSFLAFHVGKRFGIKLQSKAQLLGGFVLVLIGLKILIEHLST